MTSTVERLCRQESAAQIVEAIADGMSHPSMKEKMDWLTCP
ncbi:MAG: hypothetical protein Q4G24_16340 [Paracoccus sp. (in: a-proteobacteria)]|nr:hypothetical protein [Paracoccus sp. (in: a-proteobacteria)]